MVPERGVGRTSVGDHGGGIQGPSGLAGLVFICAVWLGTGSAYWQSGSAEAALLGAGWAGVNTINRKAYL